ncbi:MFS transporter (macronuclear) [Tetrahymena thermophila SB210]|uniref:Adenylyltransferase and sulfurtransferase MOCS3 homolog n=1 Tax=Tetrahymena thermophila (strain SB210) TaxID=312017 RepID=I7M6E7_TETTS|nr:MFS transporter [Tetrahymena thermophila SB210]EAR85069.3 MFS transporter [Tetrahymena thermophila SB210]|eukprot:XP_001032732.3 MFS transporter [Tetrahymena thermophila SB210]
MSQVEEQKAVLVQKIEKLEDRIKYLEALLEKNQIPFSKINQEQQSNQVEVESKLEQQQEKDQKGPLHTNLDDPLLTKDTIERYSRQMLLPEIKYKGQKLLQNSKVLIIGAGGIGAPAAYYISGMGVGTIGIIDHDNVEESNLHRQIIHNVERIGMNKALSAKLTIERFNHRVKVNTYQFQLTPENAQDIFSQYDIILDASDNPKTRYLVSDASVLAKKPLVSGSAIGWEGQLTVFNYKNGPCYRCLYPECPKAGSVKSCGEAGVVGMIPGIIGLLEAVECMKILIEAPQAKVLSQRMIIFDGYEGTFKAFRIRGPQKNCISCGENKTIKFVKDYDYDNFVGASCQAFTVKEHNFKNITWKEFVQEKEKGFSDQAEFIDVRPESQYDIVNIPLFKNIPYQDLQDLDENALSNLLGDKNKKIFIMCRRGNMSRLAGNDLFKKGYKDVYNVVGGINEYGRDFDQSVPFI